MDSRPRLATDVLDRFDRDGAVSTLVALPSAEHMGATDRLLSSNSPARAAISESLAAQESLLERVRTLHTRFGEVRALDERTRARERAIQDVCEAVDRFEELR